MLGKIVASMRQFGVVNAIKLALRSRFKFLIVSQKFNIFYLAKITPVREPVQSQIKLIEFMGFQGKSTKVVIGRELLSNETLFVRRQNGQVLGYALIQDGGKYQLGYALNIDLAPNVVVLKGLYVDISQRGKGLGLALNYARVLHFVDKRSIYVSTLSENIVAGKNLEKVGFELCGELDYMSLLGKVFRLKFSPSGGDLQTHKWLSSLK
jgi:predicted GNAT family acetyltransferase